MIILHFYSRLRAVLMVASAVWLSMLGAEAAAQSTRPYQLTTHPYTGPSNANVDIPMFSRGVFAEQPQPAQGRSIAWLHPDTTAATLDQYGLDWSRIAAVYVDEPYGTFNRCDADGIEERRQNVENLASAVKARSPSTRFWVNFSEQEIKKIINGCFYNQWYIDVVSMDVYFLDFEPFISYFYEWIYTHRPTEYQQLALVAPTFTGGTAGDRTPQTAAQGVERLTQFLDYAATMNQTCHLPLGPTGVTRIYDGCPVWAISGFLSGAIPPGDDTALLPMEHPASMAIFNAWQAKFAVTRIDPTQVKRVRQLTPLLFND